MSIGGALQKLAVILDCGDDFAVKMVNELPGCAVCGLCDVRALVTLRLAGGVQVTVCGTHELMHRRMGGVTRTLSELRAKMKERRRPAERRESIPGDELGMALSAAFAGERRAQSRRRD